MKAAVRAKTGRGIALEGKVPATVLPVTLTASRVKAAHLPINEASCL